MPPRSRRCATSTTKPSTFGITSVNDVPAYRIKAMNRFLGTQIKLISGYPSARDFVLASERGETDGGASTYIGLSQLFANYLSEKKLNILVQFSVTRDADMPDVPTLLELTNDAGHPADLPSPGRQRRDRPLAVHDAQCAAGAACVAARGIPEDDRRSGIPGGGGATQAAAVAKIR